MISQAIEFKPQYICLVDTKENFLRDQLSSKNIEILIGESGLKEISKIKDIDLMLNALVGYSGMIHTFIAADNGIDIALANEESLVVMSKLIKEDKIKQNKSKLFPVDSEHSAIWQCLEGENSNFVKNIIFNWIGRPF